MIVKLSLYIYKPIKKWVGYGELIKNVKKTCVNITTINIIITITTIISTTYIIITITITTNIIIITTTITIIINKL